MFKFLTEHLAGMENPKYVAFEEFGDPNNLEAVLEAMAGAGIGAMVCLMEIPPEGQQKAFGSSLDYLHLPVGNYRAPTIQQIETFVDFVDARAAEGKKVVAHCNAGYGRTGTMLTAYLISRGYSLDDAVEAVRQNRDFSIEGVEQRMALFTYKAHIDAVAGGR